MQVLVVVDMQNDFIDGALGTAQAQAIVEPVARKIAEYRRRGQMVFFTQDTHGENYAETQEGRRLPVTHCVRGTAGWQITDRLSVEDGTVIEKPAFASLALAERLAALPQLESIELVGLCTDICVISNAMVLKAALPEVPVCVDAACCAGVTPERHQTALRAMAACQIDIAGWPQD